MILTRIRIDDRSMRADEGALFSIEYVLPGCEFAGAIELNDVSKEKIPLLLLSLAELRLGRIGRGGSLIDLRIDDPDRLEEILRNTVWLGLLNELRGWLWNNVP